VSSPQEFYHFLYSDSSYAEFISFYKNRRHVIYFGANDGMFHAVNGGFFADTGKKFWLNSAKNCDVPGDCNEPELGAELWAYVPYNLLPHLQCLTDVNYNHKYYVDQRPRIFDVRLWPDNDSIHKRGWGTILVAGMRLGGYPEAASDLNEDDSDLREFTSSYTIFDITNPENPPTVLAELTRQVGGSDVNLGFTTAIPTMIIMKDGADVDDYKWYLTLGSGPYGTDAMQGLSSQNAMLSILPLEWLGQNGETVRPFRIPSTEPSVANNQGGTFTLSGSPTGFVSDLITVDFELETNYMADAVYFGTVEGGIGPSATGKMYRLVTRKMSAGNQVSSLPSEWSALNPPSGSNPAILHTTDQPVVASASVGKDSHDNFWVYFGTGRFFDNLDKSDNSTQSFYGIKEPTDCTGQFTWDTVEKYSNTSGYYNNDPGEQGLLQVDQILVTQTTSNSPYDAALTCRGGGANCRSDESSGASVPIDTLGGLESYIEGDDCHEGKDGWYRNFLSQRERNLGQATLLGGLNVFTSYQPFDDLCQAEGYSNLYALYYRTGTPWGLRVFGNSTATSPLPESTSLGRGLALTPNLHLGQDTEGPTTFVQTSTGEIIEIPQINLPVSNYKTGRTSWRFGVCNP
jgi:type IV pilus assembly protein PilY1